jgi:hypothetical protein
MQPVEAASCEKAEPFRARIGKTWLFVADKCSSPGSRTTTSGALLHIA